MTHDSIAVLLSGGVDSSVALQILKNEGRDITAFYLKIWLEDELNSLGKCPWEEDLKYAREVCKKLKVPLKIISLQKEYFEKVVSSTIAEVKKGRTPNPDILCNNQIKFGLFFDKIGRDFQKVASGHYAQIEKKNGICFLKKSPDPIKDQTYFLARLSQKQLRRILFPIGHLTKKQVRELAEKYDLPNKNRKDSQGICFLGKLKFNEFLNHYLGTRKGDIIEIETGKRVGEHDGFWYYTMGQRKGIKLGGGPFYVVKKDAKKNIIFVSRNYYAEDKKRDTFVVEDLQWFSGKFPRKKKLDVKLRHGENLYKCTIAKIKADSTRSSGVSQNGAYIKKFSHYAKVVLRGRDQGIAPGQFAVFYNKNICLGAGVMK